MAVNKTTLNLAHICLTAKTAAAWTKANPVLLVGELGLETDTLRMKIGNGSGKWSALSYTDAALYTRIEALEQLAYAQAKCITALAQKFERDEKLES